MLNSAQQGSLPRLISTATEGKVPLWQLYEPDDQMFKRQKTNNGSWKKVGKLCVDAMEEILQIPEENPNAHIECTRPGEAGRGHALNFRRSLFAGTTPQKRAPLWEHQMNCRRASKLPHDEDDQLPWSGQPMDEAFEADQSDVVYTIHGLPCFVPSNGYLQLKDRCEDNRRRFKEYVTGKTMKLPNDDQQTLGLSYVQRRKRTYHEIVAECACWTTRLNVGQRFELHSEDIPPLPNNEQLRFRKLCCQRAIVAYHIPFKHPATWPIEGVIAANTFGGMDRRCLQLMHSCRAGRLRKVFFHLSPILASDLGWENDNDQKLCDVENIALAAWGYHRLHASQGSPMMMGYGELLVSCGFTKMMMQNLTKDVRGLPKIPEPQVMNYTEWFPG